MWIAKWHELRDIRHVVAILPFIVLMYTGVCFLSNWSVRNRWMVVYPYYALFQVLVLPPLGALYYAKSWYRNGTLKPPGRYRIGFRRETLEGDTSSVLERALEGVRESFPARSGKQVVDALRTR